MAETAVGGVLNRALPYGVDGDQIVIVRLLKAADADACPVVARRAGDVQQADFPVGIAVRLVQNHTARVGVAVVYKDALLPVVEDELVERVGDVIPLERAQIVFDFHGVRIDDDAQL